MAPFREFLALVILDGDFDLPQHLSVDPAHRRAQLSSGFRGVEIEDAQEILMLEAVVRFKPAAGHERVGDADGGGALEGRSYVELIIPVKKGIVNDGEDIPLIVPPVFGALKGRSYVKFIISVKRNRQRWRGYPAYSPASIPPQAETRCAQAGREALLFRPHRSGFPAWRLPRPRVPPGIPTGSGSLEIICRPCPTRRTHTEASAFRRCCR